MSDDAQSETKFTKRQLVFLCTNLVFWTVASGATDYFWGDFDLAEEFWPFTDISFSSSFSFEEWALYALAPFVVVYFLNKSR